MITTPQNKKARSLLNASTLVVVGHCRQSSGWIYPERFTAKECDGETNLWRMIVLPHDFDPARKYPEDTGLAGGLRYPIILSPWAPQLTT